MNRRATAASFVVLTLFFCRFAPAAWVQTGQGIFFPKDLGARVEAYGSFPLTWWDSLVFEARGPEELDYARNVCRALKESQGGLTRDMECDEDLKPFLPLVLSWARDEALRSPMPSDAALQATLARAAAKASLPLDSSLLTLLRFDPGESFRELRSRLGERLQLPRRDGLFFDPETKRVVIPVKFAFPASEVEKTVSFLSALHARCGAEEACSRWRLLGMHASTAANESRIRADMGQVSRVGTVLLVLLLALVVGLGRARLLAMVPLVLIAVLGAIAATKYFFGGIHGLTLSFGAGIIGLALDYGLHRALNPLAYVWRSNVFGLLTTVGVLVVMLFSQIPLLAQLMAFSTMGITFAFGLLYLAYRYFGLRGVKPVPYAPRPSGSKAILTVLLVLGAGIAPIFLRPDFDLQSFNFQSRHEGELSAWLFRKTGLTPPVFVVDGEKKGEDVLYEAHLEKSWAEASGIHVENVARFLPPEKMQRANLATWVGEPCRPKDQAPIGRVASAISSLERELFAPYFERFSCSSLAVRDLHADPPDYVADFSDNGKWLTLFFPKPEQTALVKAKFPGATSLRELVSQFPNLLAHELRWMAPVAFLLVFGLLCLHYRAPVPALLAYLPFFSGVGLTAWACLLFHLPVSFVSFVGVIMLYGLSVDYGIFATDASRLPPETQAEGAWTAILFAATATLSGFVPLLFCRHQVLVQLGQVLTLGTLGTVLGAVWGIPSAAGWLRQRGRWP